MSGPLPMQDKAALNTPLPPLRQDLHLIEGGAEGADGARWKVHDPLSQRFFEVGADVVELLALWDSETVGQLIERARERHGRQVAPETVLVLIEFLQRHELLHPQAYLSTSRAREQREHRRRPWWSKLVHNYLFFRIPLARPDRFLRATLPLTAPFFHPAFWVCLAVFALGSLYLVSRRWDYFLETLPTLFSAAGAVAFAVSLALVKTLHELGHGYAAVRMGSRVSSMGVAFIVMMPVLYTDTTDAWRLKSRRPRVLIDAAGMAVELTIAVLATLLWIFLPEGPLRYIAFVLATTSWVLSLLINLNPLMRFDGYYLFSDLLGIANLQERSFAMGRWWLREKLFGYGDSQPEDAAVSRRRFLVGFAFATWVYRFFLFLGIALIVYHFFFKALGVVLFIVEILYFIALPIFREFRVWWERRADAGRGAWMTGAVLLGLLALLFVPLPYTVRVPAVLSAAEQQPAFAPRPARIDEVLVRRGQAVKAGEALFRLVSPELDQQLQAARERARLARVRLARRGADPEDLAASLVLVRELQMERERIGGLVAQQGRLDVRAPMDGVVVELAEEMHSGRWVDNTTRLAVVARPQRLTARGYVDSEELGRIREGQSGQFVDQQFRLGEVAVHVSHIAAAASEVLDNWLLASGHGGAVASRREDQSAWPEQAVFEVTAALDSEPPWAVLTELRGEIQLRGEPRSLAGRMLRRIVQVLVRESAA